MNNKLGNGATIIARRQITSGGNGLQPSEIVLCHLPGNRATPYVTWRRNIPELGGDGATYWGHYHSSIEDAQGEFQQRIG